MVPDQFVSSRDVDEDGLVGRVFEGLGDGPHPGVLVLHGAGGGGGYERNYARQLAAHGYTAFCPEYFGAPGTPAALAEIPLSYFERAIEWLGRQPAVDADRVGVVGFSRGGEAALLVGAHLDRVGAVVAYSASGLAFPAPTWMDGVDEEGPAWTVDGEPVPYVPVDEFVESGDGLVETVEGTADSDGTGALDHVSDARRARAAIEIENVDGPVLLVSGGADEIWSATRLSAVAIDRLDDHPWSSRHLTFPAAGHAIRVPYRFDDGDEPTARHVFGGTNAANAHASAVAWEEALSCLREGLE